MLYPFPTAALLEGLIGKQVESVVLLCRSIRIWLEGGSYIHVESSFEHVDEAGQTHPVDVDHWPAATYLHQLVLHRVSAIQSETSCLSFTFGNGALLRIFGNEGPYETGQILVEPYQGEIEF